MSIDSIQQLMAQVARNPDQSPLPKRYIPTEYFECVAEWIADSKRTSEAHAFTTRGFRELRDQENFESRVGSVMMRLRGCSF